MDPSGRTEQRWARWRKRATSFSGLTCSLIRIRSTTTTCASGRSICAPSGTRSCKSRSRPGPASSTKPSGRTRRNGRHQRRSRRRYWKVVRTVPSRRNLLCSCAKCSPRDYATR
uniref:(northern house mosquito) hypothetical protein n=1 Tax=Culex pipiens TaxID=7175 RepID=A0A8D8MM47_CULPI